MANKSNRGTGRKSGQYTNRGWSINKTPGWSKKMAGLLKRIGANSEAVDGHVFPGSVNSKSIYADTLYLRKDGVPYSVVRYGAILYTVMYGEVPVGKHVVAKCGHAECIKVQHLVLSDEPQTKQRNATITLAQAREAIAVKNTGLAIQEIANKVGVTTTAIKTLFAKQYPILWD